MKMKRRIIGTVMGVVLLATAMVASAAEEGWQFEFTPYAWLAGLEGDLTVNGNKADFDKSFSDLFDAVDVGGSFRLGAEYDRFLVGALVDYISLSTDELDVVDQPQRGSLDTDMLLTEALIGYRVDGWAEGQSFGLMVGVRNLHIENELKVKGEGTFSRDNDVTDAMFYVLPSVPVFPSKIDGLRFNPVLGIGAGDSDLAYELFPQFQYHITENVAARLGYRTVGWEYKGDNNDDNELNISLSGLIVGVGVRF